MKHAVQLFFFILALSSAARSPHAAFFSPPSLEIMAGQMVMTGFRGTGEDIASADMPFILDDIRNGRVGGVILFEKDWQSKAAGRNIVSVSQVAALCALLRAEAQIPLFIAVDQEGGAVRRLKPEHGFPESPSARELGTHTPDETRIAGITMGKALRGAGISVNFAPVADVGITPDSPAISLLDRAFSADPEQVAEHAAAFAAGLAANGIIACYKHFPGHGSAVTDTHAEPTDITETWVPEELLPYRPGVIPASETLMVMTGHLVHRRLDPVLPATLSHAVTTDLLRNELGWNGVVITDDLQMEAVASRYSLRETVRLAILAGADILLFGNNLRHDPLTARTVHGIILELVRNGEIPAERIEESWRRIRALKTSMPLQ